MADERIPPNPSEKKPAQIQPGTPAAKAQDPQKLPAAATQATKPPSAPPSPSTTSAGISPASGEKKSAESLERKALAMEHEGLAKAHAALALEYEALAGSYDDLIQRQSAPRSSPANVRAAAAPDASKAPSPPVPAERPARPPGSSTSPGQAHNATPANTASSAKSPADSETHGGAPAGPPPARPDQTERPVPRHDEETVHRITRAEGPGSPGGASKHGRVEPEFDQGYQGHADTSDANASSRSGLRSEEPPNERAPAKGAPRSPESGS